MRRSETDVKVRALKQIMFDQAESAHLWVIQAFHLRQSAEVLLKKGEKAKAKERRDHTQRRMKRLQDLALTTHHAAAFLLYGLAIENLAKGILVHLNPTLARGRLDDSLAMHNIDALLSRIPKEYRPTWDTRIAKGLQQHVEWASRYPIPKDVKRMLESLNAKDSNPIRALFSGLCGTVLAIP